MVSLLKQVTSLIFSSEASDNNLELLGKLLVEHHQLFFYLYPPGGHEQAGEDEAANVDGGLEEEQEEDEIIMEEEEAEIITEEEENQTQEEERNSEVEQLQDEGASRRKKKKKKIVRPINKHHHLMHYLEVFRKFGCAVLYWCMRFEAKHAIAKRFASICYNFLNLCLTLADVHQINHAAEILEIVCPVRDQLHYSKKQLMALASNYEGLSTLGIALDSVVSEVEEATLGGFTYRKKIFITLPLIHNHLPTFAEIQTVLIHEEKIILLCQAVTTKEYDSVFGAFLVQKDSQSDVQAVYASSLFKQPMSSWERYDEPDLIYLSPRQTIVDQLFLANVENDLP